MKSKIESIDDMPADGKWYKDNGCPGIYLWWSPETGNSYACDIKQKITFVCHIVTQTSAKSENIQEITRQEAAAILGFKVDEPKWKVGDLAKDPDWDDVTILAIDGDEVWCKEPNGWRYVWKLNRLQPLPPSPKIERWNQEVVLTTLGGGGGTRLHLPLISIDGKVSLDEEKIGVQWAKKWLDERKAWYLGDWNDAAMGAIRALIRDLEEKGRQP